MSSIRVTFNRPLTYAEIEGFRTTAAEMSAGTFYKWHFQDDRQKLVISTTKKIDGIPIPTTVYHSRDLFQDIANYVEKAYVNVYPVAVLTYED